jgi:hypothetical protein
LEALRSWAASLAVSALAGGILWLLSPKGSVQKALRAIIGVFLLCAFLAPLFSQEKFALDWIAPAAGAASANPVLEQTLLEQQRQAVEQALRRQVSDTLAAKGVLGAEISVRTDILEDGSIQIAALRVMLPRGGQTQAEPDTLRAAICASIGAEFPIEVVQAKEESTA